ncbi:permease [Ectothiorhodospira haloalkaliphila]|uniref:Permease n=1 Tax=Ectothiorhodospira haloalkaliphila TaxID=421628 RepID=W8KNY4_9GAMM|nr:MULTISPECIES: sodium-dependent bicarbonate transport family permease [Ectothiorhodospira]AHK78712.1 permease [Ectothiorhodospira haloalkaliphila]MCG5493880.1 sodium-dependent bicarbonate transport family permease [Ectothiorhodospira variabilis]MCG5498094.1 sodium-dependent bicarbonate transport family permease [Ectothiorhodospira variabilis]MCG5503683.1 sodium-dependent bicarbonate transport family permease [Ectothiorhodospira variabilis]MCG5506839.1 sodium-dependent bicarbonate transport f
MPDIVVMFFLLGLVAGLLKSDLTIPKAAYDTLSLLLMLTIGLKGGMALHGNISLSVIQDLLAVALLGALIPLILMPLLMRVVCLSTADSASMAAHYGSVSAGTFAVALAYAEGLQLTISPEVTLYLVMMELPAIMVAIFLYRRFSGAKKGAATPSIWHETLTNRGVILLVGGVIIGLLYGPQDGAAVTDLLTNAFKVVLALFLLEMGLTAAETLRPIPWHHWRLLCFAVFAPFVLAAMGMGMGIVLGLPAGSVLILTALTASASYIAAPAAIRAAIPKANIGLAMLAALGLTFPVNVIVGIPLYYQLVQWLGVA